MAGSAVLTGSAGGGSCRRRACPGATLGRMSQLRQRWLTATTSRRYSPAKFVAGHAHSSGARGAPGAPQAPRTQRVVACVGDSITQGLVSANYVDMLRSEYSPAGFRFINAGRNNDLAHSVLKRIDAVVACQPDYVTLLVGTNDVNARFSRRWEWIYRLQGRLPVRPSLAWYCESVEGILGELKARTEAQLVVLDLPMLGEDLDSTTNRRINDYNRALHEVTSRQGVACLPLHDRLLALLPSQSHAPPYRGRVRNVISASFERIILGRSWDEISRRRGLALLTDQTHLNDVAAGVVAELIGGFISPASPTRSPS